MKKVSCDIRRNLKERIEGTELIQKYENCYKKATVGTSMMVYLSLVYNYTRNTSNVFF